MNLDMAGEPPSWMNNEFLENALQNERNDPNIVIISSEIGAATAAGDNYGSNMYRATVKFKTNDNLEEASVIIKALPAASEEVLKLIENSPVFKNEAHMFAVVMPEMQKLLNKVKPNAYQPFGAKHIYSSLEPRSIAIVLQDLKREGFKLAQGDLGLDLNHGLLVMRTIARFHACSLVLYRNDPKCLEFYEDSLQATEENTLMMNLMVSTLTSTTEEVGKWEDYKDKYYSILKSMVNSCMQRYISAVKRDDASFNVLIHGDLWMKNMMFKYSEETGDVKDIR
ncbi:hypothetical protein C0J52_28191 [Blattella germanica]|nr:hypothetical protein C0J52_28191 [Blattella germanica]